MIHATPSIADDLAPRLAELDRLRARLQGVAVTDYAVVLEQADDGGWWAHAPDLPGVVSAADSPERARLKFVEVLEFYRDELRRSGEELPRPRSRAAVASV